MSATASVDLLHAFDPDAERRDRALLVLRRGDRLPAIRLWHLAGRLTPDELRDLLAAWWTDTENPRDYGTNQLVQLFRAAGFVTDTPGTTPPGTPLTAYRGAAPAYRRGLCWTLDREQAAWYARRWPHLPPGKVYVAGVPPQHVLGLFDGR